MNNNNKQQQQAKMEKEILVKVRVTNPLQIIALKNAIEKISQEIEPETIIKLGDNVAILNGLKGKNKLEAIAAISKLF